jgi:hypothetical protein
LPCPRARWPGRSSAPSATSAWLTPQPLTTVMATGKEVLLSLRAAVPAPTQPVRGPRCPGTTTPSGSDTVNSAGPVCPVDSCNYGNRTALPPHDRSV